MKRFAIPLVLVASILAACGGGSAELPLTQHPEYQLQAYAYVNTMPSVIGTSDTAPACQQLIVGFSVRSSAGQLPATLTANYVALQKGSSASWQQEVSRSETGLIQAITTPSDWSGNLGLVNGQLPAGASEEQILRGIARGCPPSGLAVNDALTVTVEVTDGQSRTDLQAPVVLGAAS